METKYYNEEEIKEYTIETLKDLLDSDIYGADLHNELFNRDYYIIGTHKAKEWLKDFTFEAIEAIREYEQDNFGEVNTDFSDPEKVVNMYVYIVGEQILYKSKTLQYQCDNILSKEDIENIIEELS